MTQPKTFRLNAQGVENLAAFRDSCRQHEPLIPVLNVPADGEDGPLSFRLEPADNIADSDLIAHALRTAAMMIDPARRESERKRAEIYHRFCVELHDAWKDKT